MCRWMITAFRTNVLLPHARPQSQIIMRTFCTSHTIHDRLNPRPLERVYLPNQIYRKNQSYNLPYSEIQHLRARRLRIGQQVLLFDGVSRIAKAEIIKEGSVVRVLEDEDTRESVDESEVSIVVAGPKRRNRMDWMIEKLVEVGIKRLVRVECERGDFERDGFDGKVKERLHRVMVSACKQCLRIRVPDVVSIGWNELIETVRCGKWGKGFVMSCSSGGSLLGEIGRAKVMKGEPVLLLVGPEGGFTEKEEETLVKAGAVRASLGPSRLRVETAAIVTVAAVMLLH